MKVKRTLFLLHRWLGVVMCLFFALWFASGIVMMYVEYPELTEQERLANLPFINTSQIHISVEEAIAQINSKAKLMTLRLSSVGKRPVYQFGYETGHIQSLYADSGELFGNLTETTVLETVSGSGFGLPGSALQYKGKIEMDQWTVSSSLHKHRPLHVVDITDDKGTVVYVSDLTGQIVRDTHRHERFWNWLGSTIHWIYPVQLRRHAVLWENVIIYLSLVGILSVLTGAIIGIIRLQLKSHKPGKSISPYKGVDKWHHLLGLFSLVFVSTFIFSGLMSMGPWGIFDSNTSPRDQINRYTGGAITSMQRYPQIDLKTLPNDLKEVEWLQVAGKGHLVLSRSAEERQSIVGTDKSGMNVPILEQRIQSSLPEFLPQADIISIDVLHEYDDYYYSRHNRYRPLPVYRVKFNDEEATWFHIDKNTGAVITRHTDASRLGRWLYNGLHSLDFSFLIKTGPLWDITVIFLSIIGMIFSVTSVIIGWRRIT